MKYIWNFQDENMKKSGASQGQSASELISKRIAELGDWRGETLSRMRKLIKEADPDVVEEWKWMGTPIWSHDGIICTGESYKNVVKLTFTKEKKLTSPPSRRSFAKRWPSTVLASRNLRRRRSPKGFAPEQVRHEGGGGVVPPERTQVEDSRLAWLYQP